MDKRIKSIKTILIVLGSILVFSNMMGLLVNSLIFPSSDIKPTSGIDILFANFGLICFVAVIVGILCLVGGVLLNPQKKWSRKLGILISILSIICIVGFSLVLVSVSIKEGIGLGFSLGFLLTGIIFSSPFMVLIFQLDNKEIKKYFT